MAWINKGNFCVHSFLLDLGFVHAISTKLMGDLKEEKVLESFINTLNAFPQFSSQKIYKNNLFLSAQNHSDNFLEIKDRDVFYNLIEDNDGFYSKSLGSSMGVYTADCMSLFIVVPTKNIVALLHAGWKGLYLNIAGQCIQKIREKYLDLSDEIFIVIGPHLKSCCFEVSYDFKDKFDIDSKLVNGEKKYYLDMEKNFIKQMENFGINASNIHTSNFCTSCNKDLFFSYRMDNNTQGRMLSILMNKGGI